MSTTAPKYLSDTYMSPVLHLEMLEQEVSS